MNDLDLRRNDPPMPLEEYKRIELLNFARRLVIATFIVGPIIALLVYPWGQ